MPDAALRALNFRISNEFQNLASSHIIDTGIAMTSGRSATELAVLAVLCVLTIFLFPVMQGPYSAVHGPVTALQAAHSAARLKFAMAWAGLKSTRQSAIALLLCLLAGENRAEFPSPNLANCASILRC